MVRALFFMFSIDTKGKKRNFASLSIITIITLGFIVFQQQVVAGDDGKALLNEICGSCHETVNGKLHRIDYIRKSPEGWSLTMKRMQTWHHVGLESSEFRAILKYLSDHKGLAPSEAKPYRYLIEQERNYKETLPDTTVVKACTVCHSYGRIALQRRDEDEWRRLVHTHIGQWPHIDMHGGLRTLNWMDIALNKVPVELASEYPLNTEEWTNWKAKIKDQSPVGTWRVWGRQSGQGDYAGVMNIQEKTPGEFIATQQLVFNDGHKKEGKGSGIFYSGYEWRGALHLGQEKVRQVFTLSEDMSELRGRWYLKGHPELGATFFAKKIMTDHAVITSMMPKALAVGKETVLSIHGMGLEGVVDLGEGIKILEVLSQDHQTIRVKVKVDENINLGYRKVFVGNAALDDAIVIYPTISRIYVMPTEALARIGETSGNPAAVMAQFDAISYWNGPDNKAYTSDDVALGVVKATWSLEPWDEISEKYEDVKYAGRLDANGLYTPNGGGPNPKRILNANNVGDMRVIAKILYDGKTLEGCSRLIVAVPKWVNAPLQ